MNIQQVIIEGIRQQMHRQAYVVLPGFGGFVLRHRPAHLSPAGTQLFPPGRTVTFNSQLKQNDGLLVNWLAQRQACTAEQALEHVRDFTNYCQGVLAGRRRLSLPGIGFFFLDFENNLCFEPLADQNFLPESFGLAAVAVPLPPKNPKPAPTIRAGVKNTPSAAPHVRVSGRRRKTVTAALLAAGTFILVTLIVSVTQFRGPLQAALVGHPSGAVYTPVAYGPLPLSRPDPTLPRWICDANGIARLQLPDVNVAVNACADDRSLNRAPEYEIVLGCFAVPGNASRLVEKMNRENIAAHILSQRHRGMRVVAVGKFSDRSGALSQLERVRQLVPEARIRQVPY